jgi:hypothetical protein
MPIFMIIIVVFFVEVECGLPFCFTCKCFPEVVDYPPFERVIEVMDDPFLVEILIYIFFWPCLLQEKK